MSYELIDTHCHLDFPEFDSDRDKVIQEAKEQGITRIVNIGSSLQGSKRSVELSEQYDCVYATVGIHPHEADKAEEKDSDILRQLAVKKKVTAIGEIGLDFFKNYSAPENQIKLFVSLVNLAKDLGLPLVIHSRQAEEETLKILKQAMPIRAAVHCFTASSDFLKECLELGFFISFTCNITYKKADNLRNLVKTMPLDRLMLETDAPYLSPENFRGKRNEPKFVKLLAEEIARIKGVDFKLIAEATTKNALEFFKIP